MGVIESRDAMFLEGMLDIRKPMILVDLFEIPNEIKFINKEVKI